MPSTAGQPKGLSPQGESPVQAQWFRVCQGREHEASSPLPVSERFPQLFVHADHFSLALANSKAHGGISWQGSIFENFVVRR